MRADSLWERRVSDNVSQRLSVPLSVVESELSMSTCIPLWLIFRVHLPLGVVANVADLGEAPNVELSRTELRHDGGGGCQLPVSPRKSMD